MYKYRVYSNASYRSLGSNNPNRKPDPNKKQEER